MRLRSPIVGSEKMMLVVHWMGGIRVLNNSVQKPWTMSAITSPLFLIASAVIALSSPAALLFFIWWISKRVSGRVGGLVSVGRSWAERRRSSDGCSPLLLLSKEKKYFLHSASRSVSLVSGVPSLLLTLTLDFSIFPGQIMDDFPCGGVVPLRVSQSDIFQGHLPSASLTL